MSDSYQDLPIDPLRRCPESDAVLSHFLDGTPDEGRPEQGGTPCNADGVSLTDHIQHCATCASKLEAARRLDASLAVDAGGLQPLDPDATDRWLDAALGVVSVRVANEDGSAQPVVAERASVGRVDRHTRIGLAAAAALVIGSVFVVGGSAGEPTTSAVAAVGPSPDPSRLPSSGGQQSRPAQPTHPAELGTDRLARSAPATAPVEPRPAPGGSSSETAAAAGKQISGIRTIDLPDEPATKPVGALTLQVRPSATRLEDVPSATLGRWITEAPAPAVSLWAFPRVTPTGSPLGATVAACSSLWHTLAQASGAVRRNLFEVLSARRDPVRWTTAFTLLEGDPGGHGFDRQLVRRAADAVLSSHTQLASVRRRLDAIDRVPAPDRPTRYRSLLAAARIGDAGLDRELVRVLRCDLATSRRLAKDLWATRDAHQTVDFLLLLWTAMRVRCEQPAPEAESPRARRQPASGKARASAAEWLATLDHDCASGLFEAIAWTADRPAPLATQTTRATERLLAIANDASRHSDRRLALLALARIANPEATPGLLRLTTGRARSLVDVAAFALGHTVRHSRSARDRLWQVANRRRSDRARLVAALLVGGCQRADRFVSTRFRHQRAVRLALAVQPASWRFEQFEAARIGLQRGLSRGASPPR